VPASENRVFAQLLRSALAGGTLRLSSSGGSTRMYLETTDAVAAIRTVLEKGEAGAVYNAANPETYCSLADMARMVCARFGGAGVSLGRDDDPANACYPPTHHLRLDVSRLLALGWRPRHSLEEMFDRMVPCLGPCR
ncbi:MAG: NAD(P)-dependent oxidoreductase, partial [Kiritimatiellae bacterium]|nr:NAD(P)-dependent oxidoreductase [Kiritimatiellia bacterium]